MTVIQLKSGDTGLIIALRSMPEADRRKLIAFGMMPGTEFKVLQTIPVYVVKIDNTELAMDYEMAGNIIIERPSH